MKKARFQFAMLARGGSRCLSSRGTAVVSFGDGSQGALGLPSSVIGVGGDAYEPTRVPGLPSNVTSVCAGHYHSLAVTSEGQVWAWGRNNEGQLGRKGVAAADSRNSWSLPRKVDGLDRVRVRAAFASGVTSAAVGCDGSLWVWGRSKRGQLGLGKDVIEAVLPSRVKALAGVNIVKVSLGWGHILAQCDHGNLYGWGYAADGRLGTIGNETSSPLESNAGLSSSSEGQQQWEAVEKLVTEGMEKEKDMPVIWEPHLLLAEGQGHVVVDIACGLDHSLVLCGDGTLLSGGSNAYGQLGREVECGKFDLSPVKQLQGHTPVSVFSGLGHSFCVCQEAGGGMVIPDSKNTVVLSWGWNQNQQLGRGGPHNIPGVIEGLGDDVSVCGGRVHSIAVTCQGEAWVWGCGRNGRLGLGSSMDEGEPSLLESMEFPKVLQASAGYDHNLMLVVADD